MQVGDTENRGTEVHFMADETIFGNVELSTTTFWRKRIRELSFLNNGVRIRLTRSSAPARRTISRSSAA